MRYDGKARIKAVVGFSSTPANLPKPVQTIFGDDLKTVVGIGISPEQIVIASSGNRSAIKANGFSLLGFR